ncbi:hypothetical protein [Leptospira noguchii]|uniref:hypothetical protein n=1 Tax=Leptospira noguchii TaxID=28182 RepID=UPI001FB84BFC|nr:hypothetical protein [Leptospira noguchii]UOG32386.1 hypothetical protein MAL06_19550 [Leptospira noguchii]
MVQYGSGASEYKIFLFFSTLRPAHVNLEGKRYGSLKSGWKFNYSIDMGAEDQPGVNRREDWSKIKNFFVTVELDLESP